MHGVFLDLATVDRDDLDLQSLRNELPEWTFHATTEPGSVGPRIAHAAVVACNKVRIDDRDLRTAPDLKLICIAATGTNNIDLEAARARNITVCNVQAYATDSVVEHVFAVILALTHRLSEYRDAVQRGAWQQAGNFCLLDFPIRELTGQTLGIVGYGELGKAVARMGTAFGMQVLIAQRPGTPLQPGRTPLHELLAQSHIVSLHCPLTGETRGLIGAAELNLMRSDAILVNTARGGIVDEAALSAALLSGQLAGAAVDVLTEEPPRSGNPLLALSLPNLIVTPHIAWAGIRSRQRLINEIAGNIRAFLDGHPHNVVQARGARGLAT